MRFVRGQSFFGVSFVNVIFEDGTDPYWARSRVLEYLSSAASRLPEGVTPALGPDATGVGWVFEYALVDRSGEHDLAALRSLQDWNLRYALASVPGVAEVASLGGYVRETQVQVDPQRLRSFGVPLGGAVEWVVIGYLVAVAALLLTVGRTADVVGRKVVWATGLGIFTAASALCGAAAAITTATSPTASVPTRWRIATREPGHFAAHSAPIARSRSSAMGP